MEEEVGNKGHKVLLVEDNPVNQKVLLRFLGRVGVDVETATDGEECVAKVLEKGVGWYSLILVSIPPPLLPEYFKGVCIHNLIGD